MIIINVSERFYHYKLSRPCIKEDEDEKSKNILMRSVDEKQIFTVQFLQTAKNKLKSEPQKKFILARQKYFSLS